MNIINSIKKDTFDNPKIIIRDKKIRNKTIYIVYNELLIDSNKVSDFIVKSLDNINYNFNIYNSIINNIYNFKYKELLNYEEMLKYLNLGFTILIIDNNFLALETKKNTARSISKPEGDNSLRGSKDAFVEDYEMNLSLIKKRIRSNNFTLKEITKGENTKTLLAILYLNNKCDQRIVNNIIEKINLINNDIITIDDIKHDISLKEHIFPTYKTTERPDIVCKALLAGKVVIMADNSNYAIILPIRLNYFFKTSDDLYSNKINVFINRTIKYMAFVVSLLVQAVYIALINYNQEILPTNLLIEFAVQRYNVPFPAFFEAFLMLITFEILKEADIRTNGMTGNSLSIVGALVLGDAAVAVSIVSPIMIIVIALSAICSLPFQEPELINAIRIYRLLFLIAASQLGIIGIVSMFIFFIIKLNEIRLYNESYLVN